MMTARGSKQQSDAANAPTRLTSAGCKSLRCIVPSSISSDASMKQTVGLSTLGGCPRINSHPSVGLDCQPRCLHSHCFVGLDIISTRPGETFPMPSPPPKGSLSAASVALRGLNRPQGTSIAPQLEQIVT